MVTFLLWYCISEQARKALARLFRKLAGYDFIPPIDDFRSITIKGKLESQEEIDRLMCQPSRWKRPIK